MEDILNNSLIQLSGESLKRREFTTTGDLEDAIVEADELIDLAAGLPSQYRAGAVFIASREFLRRISKLKDSAWNYLVQQDLKSEFGTTLMGHELAISEYCPGSNSASGDYVCIFGNLQWYWMVDSMNMQIRRLDVLYAETDQTGFILRYAGDAMPVLSAAFKRLKLK
jgi:HK97 family phage major capsid protein